MNVKVQDTWDTSACLTQLRAGTYEVCLKTEPVCCCAVSFTPVPAPALCPGPPVPGKDRVFQRLSASVRWSRVFSRCSRLWVCAVVCVGVSSGTFPAHAQAEGLGSRVHPSRSWTSRWRQQSYLSWSLSLCLTALALSPLTSLCRGCAGDEASHPFCPAHPRTIQE